MDLTSALASMAQGTGNFDLRSERKDITLVLGASDPEKTTFLQWLFGDNSKVMSVEVSKNNFTFVYDPKNSNNETNTNFPGRFSDSESQEVYYDFPGYTNSSGSSADIANSFFIKKVTDHAHSLKFLLTIEFGILRKGADPEGILKLFRLFFKLVKDVDYYNRSIGLVVTNVQSAESSVYQSIYELDEKVTIEIANILKKVEKELDSLTQTDKTNNDFIVNAKRLIKILLVQHGNLYFRIIIFRRPYKIGPISDFRSFNNAKVFVKENISKKIAFAEKESEAIGYFISDDSKLMLNGFINDLNHQQLQVLTNIQHNLETNFNKTIENYSTELEKFVLSHSKFNMAKIENGFFDIFFALNFFLNLDNISQDKNNELYSLQTKQLIEKVQIDELNEIVNALQYCDFLNSFQLMNGEEVTKRPCSDRIKLILPFLTTARGKMESIVATYGFTKILQNTEALLVSMEDLLEVNLRTRMKTLTFPLALKEFDKFSVVVDQLLQLFLGFEEETLKFDEILLFLSNLDIKYEEYNELIFSLSLSYIKLKFLCSLNAVFQEDCESNSLYVAHLMRFDIRNKTLYNWYQFLETALNKFSLYHSSDLNGLTEELSNWLLFDEEDRVIDSEKEYQLFSKLLRNFRIDMRFEQKEIYDNHWDELHKLLRYALKSDYNCSADGTWVITANYLKASVLIDKLENGCKHINTLKSINIFLSDTFFIDADFNFDGKIRQLNIIAPNWVVMGNRTFDLNGSPGDDKIDVKRDRSQKHGENGGNGSPGGNFFGLAMTILDAQDLTILANGGRGGDGGDGLVGRDGTPGRNARPIPLNDSATKSFGERGRPGVDGGNGGNAGVGGPGGTFHFINLQKGSVPIVKNEAGSPGKPGLGGQGGEGGKHGNNLSVQYCPPLIPSVNNTELKRCEDLIEKVNSYATSGKWGDNGNIALETEQIVKYKFPLLPEIIYKYKTLFQKEVDNRYSKIELIEFFSLMYTNEDLKATYTIDDAFNEFFLLQNQAKYMTHKSASALFKLLIANILNAQSRNLSLTSCLYTAAVFDVNSLKPRSMNILTFNFTEKFPTDEIPNYEYENYNPKILHDYMRSDERFITDRTEEVKLLIESQRDELKIKQTNTLSELKIMYRELNNTKLSFNSIDLRDKISLPVLIRNNVILIQFFEILNIATKSLLFIHHIADCIDTVTCLMTLKEHEAFIDPDKFLQTEIILDEDYLKIKEKFLNDAIDQGNKVFNKSLSLVKNVHFSVLKILDQSTMIIGFSEEVAAWKVPTTLSDINFDLKQLIRTYKLENSVQSIFNSFSESVGTINNIFTSFLSYFDFRDNGYSLTFCTKISDIKKPYYNTSIQVISDNIKAKLMTAQSDEENREISQYSFPFGSMILENITMTNSLDRAKKIEIMKNILTKNITETYISNFNGSQAPFYVWKSENFYSEISKFLKGERVYLFSDILDSDYSKELIKFSKIKLTLKTTNHLLEPALDTVLKEFYVKASHFGTSYYIVKKKLYVMESNKSELIDDGSGYLVPKNKAELSPYTTWQFKLCQVHPSASYEKLSKFQNNIDLELNGFGTYIDEAIKLPLLNLFGNYDSIDKRSLVFLIDKNKKFFEKNTKTIKSRRAKIYMIPSSSSKPSFFLAEIKNYLYSKIAGFFGEKKSTNADAYNNDGFLTGISYEKGEESKSTVARGNYFDLNSTILLTQFFTFSLLKDKKIFQDIEYLSPIHEQEIASHNLAKHVLPLIEEAHMKYDEE